MSIELGALKLLIADQGGTATLEKITAIDTAAKRMSASMNTAAQSTAASVKAQADALVASGARVSEATGRISTAGRTAAQEAKRAEAAAAAQAEQQRRLAAFMEGTRKATTQATAASGVQTVATQKQTAATKQLGGTLTKANGELTSFSKSGLRALNGLAFAFSQMADQGEASLRSIAGQMTSVLSLLGKGGAIASIVSTVGLAAFDIIRGAQKRAIERMALDRQTAIRVALTQQRAFLDLNETNQQFAYSQGLSSLREFYSRRSQIIEERSRAEIKAKNDQAAALEAEAGQRRAFVQIGGKDLPDALRADTLKQMDELLAQARILRAEAKAAANQGLAEQTRNTSERIEAERALADKVRGFEASRLEAQGRTHEARLVEIETEAKAYEKALAQQGVADDVRAAKVKAFTEAMRAQAALAQAQADIARYQQQLDTERTRIQNELEAGKINELQAAQQVAAVENSSLPTLREMVQRALQFAAALGDQGAVAALKQLKAEMEGLGRDTTLDKYTAMAKDPRAGASLKAAIERIKLQATMQVEITPEFLLEADAIAEAGAAVDAQFAQLMPNIAGVLGDTLGAAFSGGLGEAKDVLLRGLGGIMQQMGQALLSYGLAMQGLLPSLANPFLSGPAAIVAGAALIALGGVLGGIATGKSGGGGSAGGRSSSSATGGRDITRLFVSQPTAPPNARNLAKGVADGRAAVPSGQSPSRPAAPVTIHVGLINPNDPAGQRLLLQAVRAGERRGL